MEVEGIGVGDVLELAGNRIYFGVVVVVVVVLVVVGLVPAFAACWEIDERGIFPTFGFSYCCFSGCSPIVDFVWLIVDVGLPC